MKKKLQNMKKWIYQLFSKEKTLPQSNQDLRVLIIDDEADTISGVLGITESRRDHLYELIKLAYKNDNISKILTNISGVVNHPNELAFVCYMIGSRVERDSSNPMFKIMGILGSKFDGED